MSRDDLQNMRSAFARLYRSGLVGITVSGFLLAILSIYASDPDRWRTMSLIWTFAGYTLFLGLTIALWHALLKLLDEHFLVLVREEELSAELQAAVQNGALRLPRLVRSLYLGKEKHLTLLTEPSRLLATGMAVSIYTFLDGFEVLLGQGRVTTVQSVSNSVQVAVTERENGYESFWEAISNNDRSVLFETFIRPGSQYDV